MKKSIFKIFLASVICTLFLGINTSYSQTLDFCEDVSSDGDALSSSSVFNIGSNGGYFKFLVKIPYRIGTSSVSYEVYKVDSDGYESYDNTIYQDVEPSWTWFYKEVTFYKAGRYNIYVYDGDKNFIVSETVRVQYK